MPDHNRPRWPFPQHGKLTAHPKGKWCKSVKGHTKYFGHWRNPDPGDEWAKAALRRWLDFAQSLQNNREVQVAGADLILHTAVNHYFDAREKDMEEGNLCVTQFANYKEVGLLVLETLGRTRLVGSLQPADFEELRRAIGKGRKLGPVSVGNKIQWIRTIFKWVEKYYDVRPRYGGQFDKPPRREMRKARRARNLFSPVEIRKMLRKARPPVKCFVLLGINCGFGQTDCATVPRSAFDLRRGMLVWARGKTGVARACPLWPETVAALRAYVRPHSAEPSLMFVTQKGRRWVRHAIARDETGKIVRSRREDVIRAEFEQAMIDAGVTPRGFYTLRHTFRTMADGGGDLNAVRAIMGQAYPGMDEFYLHLNQRPDYQRRLKRVTEAVRKWVFEK